MISEPIISVDEYPQPAEPPNIQIEHIKSLLEMIKNTGLRDDEPDFNPNQLVYELKEIANHLLEPSAENLELRLKTFLFLLHTMDEMLENRSRKFLQVTPLGSDEENIIVKENYETRFRVMQKRLDLVILHSAHKYFDFRNSIQHNNEILPVAQAIIGEEVEFIYSTYAYFVTLLEEFKEIEVYASLISLDDRSFESKREENRDRVSHYLFDLRGPLTVEQFAEAFRLLTEGLFLGEHTYFRKTLNITILEAVRRLAPSRERLQELCDEYNSLVFGNLGVLEYYKGLIDLFINLIDLHPFVDWNGTIIMMLMRSLTSRRKQRNSIDDFRFIPNNHDMLKAIFDNNLLAILVFSRKMEEKRFLSKGFVKETISKKLRLNTHRR